MDEKGIVADSLKKELESFIRYSMLSLVAVVTFFLYFVERERQAIGEWYPETFPKISVFGLQFAHEQLVYAILLIPILQLVLLRPLQGILDLLEDIRADFEECRLLLSKSPSIFNPYHTTSSSRFGVSYWLSLIVISGVIVFFPAVVVMIWLTEIADGDFSLNTTIFGFVVLIPLFLKIEIMSKTWLKLFGLSNMFARLFIVVVSFVGVGYGVFSIAT
ncbi:TPA: hypothetical protein NJ351_004600 [Vibrio parahaemolyticus]|nr:hypothetical protein [Vibrio parahaemolyticus]